MRLDVGPVASTSARCWVGWAHRVLRELRAEAVPPASLPSQVLDDLDAYLDDWDRTTRAGNGTFRWRVEVDADELEYVTNAFFNLDSEVARGREKDGPAEGHAFHLVLVRALLDALAMESPPRAEFVDQLRGRWPAAAQAR